MSIRPVLFVVDRRCTAAVILVFASMFAGPSVAQVASALVRENAPMPGGGAFAAIGSINNSATNHAGGRVCQSGGADRGMDRDRSHV